MTRQNQRKKEAAIQTESSAEAFGKPPSASTSWQRACRREYKNKNAHLFHGLCLSYEYQLTKKIKKQRTKTK